MRIQIARVRRAWASVRQDGLRKEKRNTTSSVAELDVFLEEGTLREVKVQFWRRYKTKYPVDVNPSDQLLSRCYRELDKRLLTVFDIWKVKNLLHQVMSTKKRRQVGTDLYTFEEEAEVTVGYGVDEYLARLYTYLLALSVAGSNKVPGSPNEEVFVNDSAKFVKVPWDVLQAYHFRATRTVALLPEASRLAWLEQRDVSERAVWVSQFREGEETLGQVVQSVMEKRGAHWDAPMLNTVIRPNPTFQQQQPSSSQQQTQGNPKKQKGQQKGRGDQSPQKPFKQFEQPSQKPHRGEQPTSTNPSSSSAKMATGTIASQLRDGTVLCLDFNEGKCGEKGSSCSKGAHKCGKILRGGRPCGMNFHGAHNCRNQ